MKVIWFCFFLHFDCYLHNFQLFVSHNVKDYSLLYNIQIKLVILPDYRTYEIRSIGFF